MCRKAGVYGITLAYTASSLPCTFLHLASPYFSPTFLHPPPGTPPCWLTRWRSTAPPHGSSTQGGRAASGCREGSGAGW